jgi:transcriptional regulator with XRE-family HTH domain
MRASTASRHLTLKDAIEICRRRSNGEAQHRIAAAYDVNQGRISEILSGKRFPAARRLAEMIGPELGSSQG